jgi:hypothetical protein
MPVPGTAVFGIVAGNRGKGTNALRLGLVAAALCFVVSVQRQPRSPVLRTVSDPRPIRAVMAVTMNARGVGAKEKLHNRFRSYFWAIAASLPREN